jgi:hypothetical protein
MPPQLVSLRFEDLLTATGLMQLKSQAEQIINNPQATAELVFEHLRGQGLNQGWRIPVDIRALVNQIEILWSPPTPGDPGADFDLGGLLSALKELRILINQAGTAIDELRCEMESELNAFRDAITQQAAKIPFRISIEDSGGNKQFRVEQITTMPPPQVSFGGIQATLKNSLVTFTATNLTALELDAEVLFPHMLNAAGTDPVPSTLRFLQSGNRFTVTATNLPVAYLHGFEATIESLQLIVDSGNVLPGSNGNGKITIGFLDPDTSGPAEISMSIVFGASGMITYEAQTPEGHALRKGPVHIRFTTIRIITQPATPPDVAITGLFRLDGVDRPDGSPAETSFDFTYDGTLYRFEGRDFIPAPIGFGTITLSRARLHIAASSKSVVASEWLGDISFPWFDQGHLGFEVHFDNGANTLTLAVANQHDTPLQHGDIALLIKPFAMIFRNGQLDDITGNGQLTLPAIAGTQPMEVELLFSRQGNNTTLIIRVKNFYSPVITGSQLSFSTGEIRFSNGVFTQSQFEGRLKLPGVTAGDGLGFRMDILRGGQEIRFSLDPVAEPHTLEFGPVALEFLTLEITILNGQPDLFHAAGLMTLPSVTDPFAFTMICDTASNPADYTFTITGLKSTMGMFELEVEHFSLRTQAGTQPQIASDGRIWLPVFSSGDGIFYDFSVTGNNTYRIRTRAGSEGISFAGFELSQVDIEIDVTGGIIQGFAGTGSLKVPGLQSPLHVRIAYDNATRIHRITLLTPLTGIPVFGCTKDIDTFQLELQQGTFHSGAGSGKLRLPGTGAGQGLSYTIAVNDQGDYDILVSGNDEKLHFRVVELIIPTPGFSMQIRGGVLQNAAGQGILNFPGLTSLSPLHAAFAITGSGNPVQYGWMARVEDATASVSGFILHFDVAQAGIDPAGSFSAEIRGNMHLPVFTEGVGFGFTIHIPDDTTYQIAIDQHTGKAAFGGFELDRLNIGLTVQQGELQDFNGQARLLIPCFTDTFDVAVTYLKSNNSNQNELRVALPSGTPDIPLFGGEVKFDTFSFTMLNGAFGACDGKGVFRLPGAVGTGGMHFGFSMDPADAGRNYRLQLDTTSGQPAQLDFHALKLNPESFLLEINNSQFHRLEAAGMIEVSGMNNSTIHATVLATVPPGANGPMEYTINGSGSATIGSFSIQFGSLTIQKQGNSFSASAQGSLSLPVFNNGTLGFQVAFSNSGNDYDIVVSNNTHELTFGSFGLLVEGITLRIRSNKLDEMVVSNAQLRIPGMQTPLAVNVSYLQSNPQGRESLEITMPSPFSAGFGGGHLTINSDFRLLVLDGGFESCQASGILKLPGSNDIPGEGIRFNMTVENGGERFSLTMAGNPQDNKLSFGPVELGFTSFSLLFDNGRIEQASGAGTMTLPGFSAPVQFDLSIDQAGAAPQFRLHVQNADIDLSDFRVHFTEILLISSAPEFVLSSSGHVKLPVFDDGQMDFNLHIDSNQQQYGFNINGDGTTMNAGALSLKDFNLGMQIINGAITNATGSGKLRVADFTPEDIAIAVTYDDDPVAGIRNLRFNADVNMPFDLNLLTLTLKAVDFHIRNSNLQAGTITGSVTIPTFSGPPVNFGFSYSHNPTSFTVDIASTGVLTSGVLTLTQVSLNYSKTGAAAPVFGGTAGVLFPGAANPATVSVNYNNNRLTFAATAFPTIQIGGFSLAFTTLGFAIEKSGDNHQLTDLNFAGIMTIPACETGHNTLTFLFDMSGGGNRYFIRLNSGSTTTSLKIGPVTLSLHAFNLEIENGGVKSLSGNAGLTINGLNSGSGSPATIAAIFGYNSSGGKYTVGLDTSGGPSFDINLGGFTLKLRSLELNFTATSMEWPFKFSGGLIIPGLKDSNQQPAEITVNVSVTSGDQFNVQSSSSAVFTLGNLKVSDLSVSIAKAGSDLNVEVKGVLTIEGLGGEAKSIAVEIEIQNDGTFRILGEAKPAGSAIKLLDIPSTVRIYLSMIELSRKNDKWGFAMGGRVENLIVIPGMDNLLPNEVNLRTLRLADNFDLDLGVKWPSGLNINIGGDGGGDVSIPVNGKFGDAISLDALKISYGRFDAPVVPIKFMFMGASIRLGPVAATVDGLGAELTLSKRDPIDNPGNFGVVQIDVKFLPPMGLGISLDTPVFTGGGYLFFDEPKGEYAGAVELSFKGMFAISAIGLINSKMPDGKPGTSVLFIMSVEFTPGIALGFGFFISGLGGIIGIHRTIQVEKLREGVKTGTIKNILFPKNIIANISRIISDIKEVFPVKRDQFIIGPMAAITWGVPTIMRLDLGLAIEFANPVRFGILGVLRVILPDEKVSLIRIQVAFLGLIDFEKKMLSFDASLFDSKVLTFGLEGDMALRLSWGDKKDFVLSVGGFHPRYSPPAHLCIPKMNRLTIKILTGNPRLTLFSYFAVTSNTVQFGAGLDFHFSISKFKVVGEFGFDVLFQFSPFYFIADAYARLAVKLGSTTLLGISLEFTLEGPTPWRARGLAKFTILFVTFKVKFDKTWGEKRDTKLPDITVLPLLMEAVTHRNNWRTIPGAHGAPGVRMKGLATSNELILTPNGIIEVSQKIVPFKSTIEKFGQYSPKDHAHFEVIETRIGTGSFAEPEYVMDNFSPGNFLKVSDKDKLKLPSFEEQPAGIHIRNTGAAMVAGVGRNRTVNYEQIIEDKEDAAPVKLDVKVHLGKRESAFMMTHGAVGRSRFSNRKSLMVNPKKVKVAPIGYAVADTDTLQPVGGTFAGYMQAHEAMKSSGAPVQIIPVDIIKP